MKKKNVRLLVMCVAAMISVTGCEGLQNHTVATEETVISADEEKVEIPNPWKDYASLEEASDASGIAFKIPEQIGDAYPYLFQAIDGEILQVFYQAEKAESAEAEETNMSSETNLSAENGDILLRKGTGSDDISGDYNSYEKTQELDVNGCQVTFKGEGEVIKLAIWTNGEYAYSVSTPGCSAEEMEQIISQME